MNFDNISLKGIDMLIAWVWEIHIQLSLMTCFLKTTNKQKLLDIEQQKLVKCIGYEITAIDTIVERSGFSADKIASMLPLIEIAGQVISVPGGYTRA